MTKTPNRRRWYGNWETLLNNFPGTSRRRSRLQNKPERREAKREVQAQLQDREED